MALDRQAMIQKYLPELTQPAVFTQEDLTTALGRSALDKATIEKQLNFILDKLIYFIQENESLKDQLVTLQKKVQPLKSA
jgi:hypothetical protein